MSWEAYWYRCYSEDGEQPYCRRLNRESMSDQLDAAIDLAIARVAGRAGCRPTQRTLKVGGMTIVEHYWSWIPEIKFRADVANEARVCGIPWRDAAETGGYESAGAAQAACAKLERWIGYWWLIPDRVTNRSTEIIRAATAQAVRAKGWCEDDDIERVLRCWRKRRKHRRFAARISPRRPPDSIGEGYGTWHRKTFEPHRRKRRTNPGARVSVAR